MADDLDDPEVLYGTRVASYGLIQFGVESGIARITLNRQPANVLSVELMQELNRALESMIYQREIKLVVLAAAGRYFSAGFELSDHLGDRAYLMLEEFRKVFENLARLDKPTFGVVSGPALGAGCVLAGGCDIVYAAASAKFGQPEVKAGVFNTVAAAVLPRLVGRRKAFEMLLGGVALSAAEAERVGLISRVLPDDRLEAEAAALVQRFQEGSAPVLQCIRRAVMGGLDVELAEAFRHAEDVFLNQLMATEDAEEGLRAVMAKRKPVWKDR